MPVWRQKRRVKLHRFCHAGLTVVITEQNANFSLTLAERLYVLEAGRVQTHGTAAELMQDDRLSAAYFGTH